MNKRSDSAHYSDRAERRKQILTLGGLLGLMLIANTVAGLFALNYSNSRHVADITTLTNLSVALESGRSAQVYFKTQVQEWKNILLRGDEPADLARYKQAFETSETLVRNELDILEGALRKVNLELPLVSQIRTNHAQLGTAYREALASFRPEDPLSSRKIDQQVRGVDRELTVKIDESVVSIQSHGQKLAAAVQAESDARYQTLHRVSLIFAVIGIALLLAFLVLTFNAFRRS